jgi:hypothetical protein
LTGWDFKGTAKSDEKIGTRYKKKILGNFLQVKL